LAAGWQAIASRIDERTLLENPRRLRGAEPADGRKTLPAGPFACSRRARRRG